MDASATLLMRSIFMYLSVEKCDKVAGMREGAFFSLLSPSRLSNSVTSDAGEWGFFALLARASRGRSKLFVSLQLGLQIRMNLPCVTTSIPIRGRTAVHHLKIRGIDNVFMLPTGGSFSILFWVFGQKLFGAIDAMDKKNL